MKNAINIMLSQQYNDKQCVNEYNIQLSIQILTLIYLIKRNKEFTRHSM